MGSRGVGGRGAPSHARTPVGAGGPPCDQRQGCGAIRPSCPCRRSRNIAFVGRNAECLAALPAMSEIRRPLLLALPIALVAGTLTGVSLASTAHQTPVAIKTLSVRADLVSGGHVLTEVVLPRGVRASSVRVSLNGHDITRQFALRANHRYEGLLSGLRLGANSVVARVHGGHGARLTVANHRIGGPAFSGPQIQPWACQSTAKDKQCNQAPSYSYFYE